MRQTAGFGETEVADWQDAGLIKPSVFKPVITTIEQELVIRPLGQVSSRDSEALSVALTHVIG